jgi:hypothetical protein
MWKYPETNEEWLQAAQEDSPGWYSLIVSLNEQLEYLFPNGYKIQQIKEKFGALRFYWNADEDNIIVRQIAMCCVLYAENTTRYVCEKCGKRGELRETGWVKTLCDEHYKQHHNYKEEE